jgi:pyrroline-5-carboxylate reductase
VQYVEEADLNELHADNIYLRGGGSMAEALLLGKESKGPSQSMAMRLKRNRDALLAQNYDTSKQEDENLYQPNPF